MAGVPQAPKNTMKKSVRLARPPKKVPCRPCGPGMQPTNLCLADMPRRNIKAALLADAQTVAAFPAPQFRGLALIGQRLGAPRTAKAYAKEGE